CMVAGTLGYTFKKSCWYPRHALVVSPSGTGDPPARPFSESPTLNEVGSMTDGPPSAFFARLLPSELYAFSAEIVFDPPVRSSTPSTSRGNRLTYDDQSVVVSGAHTRFVTFPPSEQNSVTKPAASVYGYE